jgi:diguanylate cyclase (GGDEF)-like protein
MASDPSQSTTPSGSTPSSSAARPSLPPLSEITGEVNVGPFGAMLGRSPFAPRVGLLNNAEIVVWQASRRLTIALTIGIVAVLLRATGVVSGPVWPLLAIVPAYLGVIALLTVVIERRQHVSRRALIVLALTDLAAIFATVALVTEPAFYPRALLVTLIALQFTQMFFGRSSAITVVVGSTLGYLGLVALASHRGTPVKWMDEAWLLALYLLVALNGMALHASANRRLTALVDLFAAAQRGDFSRPFVEERGREPDGITLLGRSYNHLRSELATMVMNDPLTGCLNRRGFDQALEQTVSRAGRRGGYLAVLAIDIDHFKAINDTIGHLGGDAVLREVAGILSRSSRGGDVVGRVGGEEFVILLPDADSEMAGVVAERVRESVRGHTFQTSRGGITVTVSVGIASEQVTDAHAGRALRARADEALYVAKRLGRDRVVMWAPGIRSNATPPFTFSIGSM